MSGELWLLGGWTMVHFVWLGALVAAGGGVVRLAFRGASPTLRYAISLMTLAGLAVMPLVIAAWLATSSEFAPSLQARPLKWTPPDRNTAPAQSPRLQASGEVVVDLASTGPLASSAALAEGASDLMAGSATSGNPSPSPSLQGRGIALAALVEFLPWAWVIGAPLTFSLLAAGLVGSERLRRGSAVLVDGAVAEACERLRVAMRIGRRVSVAVCEGVAQPVLIGIVRPLILLPTAAISGWTPAELEMVLVHELAHVRRWDNLVNLMQRMIESLLFFHPAVWLVSRQVRRDREECCDAVVVGRTAQPHAYAELLVAISSALPRGQAPRLAASAMADHPLAGRIRQILKLNDEPMRISRRTLVSIACTPVLLYAATMYTASADEDGGKPSRAKLSSQRPSSPTVEVPTKDVPASIDPRTGQALVESQVQAPRLQAEINRLEDLIVQTNKELVNIQLFKQIALQNARSPAAMKAAISASVEKDPIVAEYRQELFELEKIIRGHSEVGERASEEQLEKLQQQLEDVQQQLRQHLRLTETAVRDEIANMPNEALRAAIAEHRIRYEAAKKNLQKYEEELGRAKQQMKALSAATSSMVKSYSVGDVDMVRFADWMRLVGSDQSITFAWNDGNQSLSITAPASVHEEIAKFVTSKRDTTAPAPFAVSDVLGLSKDEARRYVRVELTSPLEAPPAPQEIERRAMNLLQLAKSPGVLKRAIVRPELSAMPLAKQPEEFEKLLAANLSVSYPDDGEILEFVLRAPDAEPIVEQIALAFEAEVALTKPGLNARQMGPGYTPYIANPRPSVARTTYKYDGKTFEEWRDQWRLELKTERRIEAIRAMEAFAKAGRGKEAAEAILDVAGEYDFTMIEQSSEGKLKQAIIDVLANPYAAKVSQTDWLPAFTQRIEADPKKWRTLGTWLLANGMNQPAKELTPEVRELLMKWASDDKYGPNLDWLLALLRQTAEPSAELKQLVRKTLAGEDTGNALVLLQTTLFNQLDEAPEQFDLLFHSDMNVSRQARTILASGTIEARSLKNVAERLLGVLRDGTRHEEHADALRGLGAVSSEQLEQIAADLDAQINSTFSEVLKSADADLAKVAAIALMGRHKGGWDLEALPKDLPAERLELLNEMPEKERMEEMNQLKDYSSGFAPGVGGPGEYGRGRMPAPIGETGGGVF